MGFITNDFLLQSETARRLYHQYAAVPAIFDYHSHLPPKDIAEDRRFENVFEIWLAGDHYKWRAMRADGVAERFCTGDASPREKFLAWAKTVPQTLRNPLYHWTHLELARYFGIDEALDESSAQRIWDRANAVLKSDELTARGILKKFRVNVLCTTDDPSESLAYHKAIADEEQAFRIYPTFRPDKALQVHLPEAFNAWADRLGEASNVEISSFQNLLDALKRRHDEFHALGARASDHGLNYCYVDFCSESTAARIFDKARSGKAATAAEHAKFAASLMLYFGHLDSEKGWTKQLHLGALRNANTRARRELGTDSGFDSIGDWPQAEALCAYLDRLDLERALPKVIVYNANPADNFVFATAVGNFQDGNGFQKLQFGTPWWFLDQKEGIEWQLNTLSNTGLLARFIGMTADSRSFMSFPRHEYFRRVLCNLLGRDMESGDLPNDEALIGNMVRNISYENARQYIGVECPDQIPAQSQAGV
jgi:glucuronate isomerase